MNKVDGRQDVGLSHVIWTGHRWMAVGRSGAVASSPDGFTWTGQDSGCTADLTSVVWTGTRFVAVGYDGVILSSPDGGNWRLEESGTKDKLRSVIVADGRLVAVGDSGTILVCEFDAAERAEADKRRAMAEAWESRKREAALRVAREASGACILCGKRLGLIQKLSRAKQHKQCTTFTF